MPNLWIIFTTGLIAGGITCAAVQGGLLAATLAAGKSTNKILPIISFLLAKLVAYTIVGALLGIIGTAFTFSLTFQALLLTVVAVFMVGTALAMLDVHPIFRYFVIQPPKFLTRIVRAQSKSQSVFAPALLGAFTIFIPCGTTQAMMAIALGTRDPLYGAAVMAAFIVGTFPIFFGIGYAIEVLKDVFTTKFAKVASVVIIVLALGNLKTAAVISGASTVVVHSVRSFYCTLTFCSSQAATGVPVTQVTMYVESNGYRTDTMTIAKGQEITLTLINDESTTCAQAFTIPSLGVQAIVPKGSRKTISFKAPEAAGRLAYTCSMGMYGDAFTVL